MKSVVVHYSLIKISAIDININSFFHVPIIEKPGVSVNDTAGEVMTLFQGQQNINTRNETSQQSVKFYCKT
jgi:hypothetical protein